jgi:hypothetical protein
MASIKSIQDILSTYQKAYGADALMAELALFQKSPLAPSKKITVPKKPAPPASAEAPSSASSVVSETKEKKVRGPSAWNVFIEKVAGKGKDETPEFSAWKTLQVEKKGNLKMVFASEQKAADPAAYKSFADAFEPSVPAPKPSVPSSKPSGPAPAPKAAVPSPPASVSSDTSEKKKAGRPKGSKNKAKDSESSESEGEKPKEEKKKRQWSEEAKKAAAAKRAAKKAAKTPEEAAKKPLPESDDESEAGAEMSSILYEGENLFWNELTGQTFENIDGAMGDLVGTFDGITLTRV